MIIAIKLAHIFSLALLTGSTVFNTFIASLIQYRTLSKHVFGQLQARQFPFYFSLQTVLSLVLIGTTSFLTGIDPRSLISLSPEKFGFDQAQVMLFITSAGSSMLNLGYVGPKLNKVKQQRLKLEKEGKEVPEELVVKFGRYHGFSLLGNLAVVTASVVNCYWIAKKI